MGFGPVTTSIGVSVPVLESHFSLSPNLGLSCPGTGTVGFWPFTTKSQFSPGFHKSHFSPNWDCGILVFHVDPFSPSPNFQSQSQSRPGTGTMRNAYIFQSFYMPMFFNNKVHGRIDKLHESLKESFGKVRSDNANLTAWIKHLQQQNIIQRKILQRLNLQQNQFLKRSEVMEIMKAEYPVDTHLERLELVSSRIENLEKLLKSAPKKAKSEPKVRHTNLQRKIVKNVARQSKEYIKKVMLALCRKYNQMSANMLREMVVDEQKLCSRSSFYRLISELNKDGSLSIVSTGKDRVFAANRKVFK